MGKTLYARQMPWLMTYVQLKAVPESFVLNPLDSNNVKSRHGFAENSLDLLKLIWGALEGDTLENTQQREKMSLLPLQKMLVLRLSDTIPCSNWFLSCCKHLHETVTYYRLSNDTTDRQQQLLSLIWGSISGHVPNLCQIFTLFALFLVELPVSFTFIMNIAIQHEKGQEVKELKVGAVFFCGREELLLALTLGLLSFKIFYMQKNL